MKMVPMQLVISNRVVLRLLGPVWKTLMMTGQPERSVAALEEAVRLAPGHAWASSTLALAYRDVGRLDEALVAIRKALQRAPGEFGYRFNLGLIHTARDELEEASRAYRAAIAINPEAWHQVGGCPGGGGRRGPVERQTVSCTQRPRSRSGAGAGLVLCHGSRPVPCDPCHKQ